MSNERTDDRCRSLVRKTLDRRRFFSTAAGVVTGSGFGGTALTSVTAQEGGDTRWRFRTRSPVYSSPTVADGTVFVGNTDAQVHVLDAATGEEIWVFETGDTVYSSPTVVDDTVFVGSHDGHVYALDAETGEERWAFETTRDSWVWSSPTVVDGTVFVGSTDNHVYALDAATSEEIWAFETGNIVNSSPTVVDDTVFVGSNDNHVYALDARTGNEIWSFQTGSKVTSSPTVADGTVYVGGRDDNVYALDVETGEKVWSFETGGSVRPSPTVVDNTVFIGSYDGHLGLDGCVYALDARTGNEIWSFQTSNRIRSSPTVADDTVFIGCRDNRVYALDTETGEVRWLVEKGSWVLSSPTVVDGTVFVGDEWGVLALDANVDGSSEGSRVKLGTLGHHDDWQYANQTIDFPQPEFDNLRIISLGDAEVGDIIEIPIRIDNFGNTNGDVTVTLEFETSDISAETELTIGPGETGEYTFEIDSNDLDAGKYEVTVIAADLTSSETITIAEPIPNDEPSGRGGNETSGTDADKPSADETSGMVDDVLGTRELIAVGGGGSLVTLLSTYAFSRRFADESDEGSTDHSPDSLQQQAETAVSKADQARNNGEFEKALEQYATALETYREAHELVNMDSESRDAIVAALEQVRDERESVRKLRDSRENIRDLLSTAEISLQSAITSHVRNDHTVSGIRYRQAKNTFETALDQIDTADQDPFATPITVSVDVEGDSLPAALKDLPGLDADTADRLAEVGFETIADLRDNEDELAELETVDAIDSDIVVRLTALSWSHGDDEYTFTDRADVDHRYDRAATGSEAVH